MRIEKTMFNHEQKQAYIDHEGKNSASLRRYFIRLKDKEIEYNKDVADMTVDEYRDTIMYLGIRRTESRRHLLSLLNGYFDWAKLNQKTHNTENLTYSVTPVGTNSSELIRQTMIKDPEHLDKILKNSFDFVDYEFKSKRDSLVAWLLFCGIDLNDLSLLRKNDIDKQAGVVKVSNGNNYKIENNLIGRVIDLWNSCSTMTYIERKNGKSKQSKDKKTAEYINSYLVDNDYLFRPVKGSKPDPDTTYQLSSDSFRIIIDRIFEGKKKNIPARNINYSGKFYQIYLFEKENGSAPPELFCEKFNIKPSNFNEALIRSRKWRDDYNDWKLAFDLI